MVSQYLFQCYDASVAMKAQIPLFDSAGAISKSSGKAIRRGLCFAAMGLGFQAVVLRDDRYRIP
jgi:hypothetical protein